MELTELSEYGYLGLFLASFLAATILPLSSEALLLLLLYNQYDPIACLFIATAGNWLGGMSSYYIGRLGKMEWIEKFLHTRKEKIERLHHWVQCYGSYTALFCWLPVVGDPLAIALGFFRANPLLTALLMLAGKFIRFAVVIWGAGKLFSFI